jgi:hypothetical protein
MSLPLVFGTNPFASEDSLEIPSSPASPLAGFVVFGGQPFGATFSTGTVTPTPAAGGGVITMAAWPAGPVDVGDTITVGVLVRDEAGTPVNVDLMVASVTAGGTAIALTVTNPSTGRYEATFTIGTSQARTVAFLGTGGVLGAGQVYVDAVPVADSTGLFISVPQALAHLRAAQVLGSHEDREQLRWLALVACRAVERDLGRVIARRTIVEEHEPTGNALILRQTPVLSVTTVGIDGSTQAPAGYRLGIGGILRSRTGWPVGGWSTVQVEYVAGMDPVPEVLQKVALNAVQRMWQTSQNSPHPAFGDGAGTDFGPGDLAGQMGRLTPVEMGAYRSYQSTGIA